MLKGLKRYAEALAAYEQALALDPKFVNAWNGKGAVLTDQKRYAEALPAYEQALTLDPRYVTGWKNKAIALRGLGRRQRRRRPRRGRRRWAGR